jgi:hypothetical protein
MEEMSRKKIPPDTEKERQLRNVKLICETENNKLKQ